MPDMEIASLRFGERNCGPVELLLTSSYESSLMTTLYTDPTLQVLAMANLGTSGLPHVVNVLLITSIFSADNMYTFCATR